MKKNDKENRDSKFEAMRILSMFFIVMYHIIIHGLLIEHSSGLMKLLLIFIESILLVCVNSFVLVTGYFQCEKNPKPSKVIKLINQTWFYKVVIMLLLVFCGIIMRPDNVSLIRVFFPIDYGTYWYINCYIILYLISPLLNKIINNCTKKEFQQINVLLFFIISICSTFSVDVYYNSYSGRSLCTFILLYFIGAYLKKYPIEKNKFLKKYKNKSRIIFLAGFFICVFLSVTAKVISIKSSNYGNVMSEIGKVFEAIHVSYASPVVLFESIFYFLFFGTLSFKSKLVDKISTYTLGVYLISENIYVRESLYDLVGLTKITDITLKLVIMLFLAGILIYIFCTIIEYVRQLIFNFISNTSSSKKIRIWFSKKIDKFKIALNW